MKQTKHILIYTIVLLAFMSAQLGGLPDIFLVSSAKSSIDWKSTNDEGKANAGKIKFKSGSIKMDTKQIVGGFFYVNMLSMNCSTIADEGFNKALIDDMRTAEYLNIIRYKEMTGKIVKATRKDVPDGQPNYDISLQVTLKGIKKMVMFPATVGFGKKVTTLKGNLTLSKADFNIPNDLELSLNIISNLKKK